MKQNFERYHVDRFIRGKDQFSPDKHCERFDDLCSALIAAESKWESGDFEMVSITDWSPMFAKTDYPYVLWLKHRSDQYGSRTISDSQPNVLMPYFSPSMDWLAFPVQAETWMVNYNGGPLSEEKPVGSDKALIDLLQQILNCGYLNTVFILGITDLLNFDGFSIKNKCAHFYFS